MPKYFSILFAILIASNINGQDSLNIKMENEVKLHAFEFVIYNEQSLSYRYRFANDFHLKFGLDLTAIITNDNEGNENYTLTKDGVGISINSQIFYRWFHTPFVNFNIGAGPTFSYSTEKNIKYSRTYYSAGILTTVGSDLKLSDYVFLLFKLDYLVSFGMQIFEKEVTNPPVSEHEDKEYYFNMRLSSIGIGFGFWL